jgi:hypothetical protein
MRRTVSLSLLAGAAFGASGAAAIAETGAQTSSNDEVRAMVAEMLADAESRTSLLQGGGSAGHDGNFFLASPDGNFRLNVSGQMQFRYVMDLNDDSDPNNQDQVQNVDDFDHGFEMRRTKLVFDGHVYSPDLMYKIQGNFSQNGGAFGLEDAWIGWRLYSGSVIKAGQFKAPFLREELVSSKYQLAVDRSFTGEFFSANRTQGIMFENELDNLRYAVSFNEGMSNSTASGYANIGTSQNTGFNNDGTDWAFSGRVEFLLGGEWGAFKDFTSEPGAALSHMVGAAFHIQGGAEMPTGDNDDLYAWTVDYSIEGDGWNAFAAFIGNSTDAGVTGGADGDNWGFVVQGGLNLDEANEIFARYDYLGADDSLVGANDELSTLTLGWNHYVHGHAAKFTVDLNWVLDESMITGDPNGTPPSPLGFINNPGIGYLGSNDSDEIYIRAQFQLLF